MPNTKLITLSDPRSPVAEAYRTLRTNLLLLSPEKPISAFVVASCAQADGKSSAAANLAVAFAQAGNRTILVDADMRRPAQSELWGISNEPGLSTMFTDDSLLSNPPLVSTEQANLSLLPAGAVPVNPADLLSGSRMDEIIGLLKARANYVIFEAPPVLAVTDGLLLGSKTSGVVLVVRAGKTLLNHTQRAREALARVNVRVLGAALTNARSSATLTY